MAFLLNIRQCRYQALVLFLATVALGSYYRYLRTRKLGWLTVLTVAAIAFFYAQLLLCAVFLVALAVVHGVFHRRELGPKERWKLVTASSLFLLATVPYAIHYRLWVRPDIVVPEAPLYVRGPTFIWLNLRELNLQNSMPWLVLAGLLWFLYRQRETHPRVVRTAAEWLVLSLAYVVGLSFVSPQSISKTAIVASRYLVPILPLLAGLAGMFLWFLHRISPPAAVLALGVLVTTNLASLHPWNRQFRWLLPAYLSEIAHPYPTCYSETVQFLKENANPDGVVFCSPNYTHGPLVFYLGDRLRLGCTLDRQTKLPLEKIRSLPAPLLVDEHFPDWVILFGGTSAGLEALQFFRRPHAESGRTVTCDYQLAKVLDTFWFDLSRPELPWHHFGPKQDFNRNGEAVYVFRKAR